MNILKYEDMTGWTSLFLHQKSSEHVMMRAVGFPGGERCQALLDLLVRTVQYVVSPAPQAS